MHEPEHQEHRAQGDAGGMEEGALAPKGPRLAPAQRRRRTALILGGVLVAGIVLAASLDLSGFLQPAPRRPPHPRPPIALPLYRDGQTCGSTGPCTAEEGVCPQDAAWSADGTRIAILSSCFGLGFGSNKLFLYDAASGALLRKIVLDDIILHAPNVPVPPPVPTTASATPAPNKTGIPCLNNPIPWFPSLQTSSILWSPDGQLVAPFAYTISTHALLQGPGCPLWSGVLLMDTDGGHPQVLLQQNPQAFGPCYAEWDLQRGRLVPVQQDASAFFSCLTPALGYQWEANGVLAPISPLAGQATPSAQACNPPGDANRGTSFAIWQGGWVQLDTPTYPQPGVYTWNTTFAAWSPDGRYLTSQVYAQGRVQPAGLPLPSQDTLVGLGLDQAPVLPIHDPALAHVAGALAAAASPANDSLTTAVAWRPDGRALATEGPEGDKTASADSGKRLVDLYDCASGRKLASLVPLLDAQHLGFFRMGRILSWAPNGKHLLFISPLRGTGTIWGPSQLSFVPTGSSA